MNIKVTTLNTIKKQLEGVIMLNKNQPLLTISEASTFLNMKSSRIRYEVFKKRIPFIKLGKSIRFDEKDLISWVLSQKQEAKSE